MTALYSAQFPCDRLNVVFVDVGETLIEQRNNTFRYKTKHTQEKETSNGITLHRFAMTFLYDNSVTGTLITQEYSGINIMNR